MNSASEAFLYCFNFQKYLLEWHPKVPPALGSPWSWGPFRLANGHGLCGVLVQLVALSG